MTEKKEEPDSLQDAPMADLMRRWGRHVRARPTGEPDTTTGEAPPGRLFEPPGPDSELHRRLDEVDHEMSTGAHELPKGAPSTGVSRNRLKPGRRLMLAAASLAAILGIWWFSRSTGEDGGQLSPQQPLLSNAHLSVFPGRVRDATETSFRSGEAIYLHFDITRETTVFVGLLDSSGSFVAVSSDAQVLGPGSNRLGCFVLDDNPGREAFVIMASEDPRGREFFERLVSRLNALVSEADETSFEEKLKLIAGGIDRHRGVSAEILRFDHVPP
ncbi:MAG: hypothetical protein AB1486_33100 [Planctomycetota bacterium]